MDPEVPGDAQERPPTSPPTPASPGAPAPTAAPPPAASRVLETPVSERDAGDLVELRRKLSEAERLKREVELKNAQLEDENTRLRTPAPVPPAPKKKRFLPRTAYEAIAEGEGED